MANVAGQGIVVTGAGHGIGRALATRLASEGARVVVNDLDVAAVSDLAREIDAHPVPGDAATQDGVRALVEAARDHLGEIDVWCGNAGLDRGKGLEASEDDWALLHDVNVMAHVRAARLLVPAWVERGRGRYVMTASAAGLLTMLASPTYSVTKHAAVAFAEWLSATYRHRGVVVQAVCPQAVQTRMFEDSGPLKDLLSHDALLTPEQVAGEVWAALADDRFFILPHPQVADYYAARAADTDRWLAGMNRLQQALEDQSAAQQTGDPA